MLRYTLRYLHTVFGSLADPDVRPFLVAAVNLIAVGTIFYSIVEGWQPLDAAYFCVVTLATIGYGDFTPETGLGKLFTVFYIVAGLAVIGAFIGAMTRVAVERAQEKQGKPRTRRHWRPGSLGIKPTLQGNPAESVIDDN
jgi:voltage-gated potassium channel